MVTDLFDPTVDCRLDTINNLVSIFFSSQYVNIFILLVFVLTMFLLFKSIMQNNIQCSYYNLEFLQTYIALRHPTTLMQLLWRIMKTFPTYILN